MNNIIKHKLAYKSNNLLFIFIICIISLIGLFIFSLIYLCNHNNEEYLIIQITTLFISVIGISVFLIVLIKFYRLPNVLIEYNDNGLYLNYPNNVTLFIDYYDVKEARRIKSINELIEYKSGSLEIITNDNHYKVDFIKDIKNVEKSINELINKYKKFKL